MKSSSRRTRPNRTPAPSLPDTVVEIEVEGITSEGAGVGRLPDGRVAFIHRTAPGDRVSAAVQGNTARWARGKLLSIEAEGEARREAPCPYFDRCGGCTLQHLSYPAQLAAKRQVVLEALRRIGKWEDLPEPIMHGSPLEFRYRNRMTFTLLRRGVDGGTVVAGLHEIERPERVLDIDGRCLLPEEPIARVWDQLRSEWGPGAVRLPFGPELRLTLRATVSGKVLLAIEGGKGAGEPEELLKRIPDLEAIWQTFGGTERSPKLLAGESRTQDLWEGEAVELRPTAFLQVNRLGAEPLRKSVVGEVLRLGEGRRVLDAYCGAGIYGREIARSGRECIGIELDAGAVRVARDGAPSGFQVISGRVEDRLSEALPADVAILNPPRTGVGKGVMEALVAAGVKRIVYVSCDPATLARDTSLLGSAYRVTSFQIFDLFPQTAHIETVLTLDLHD